MTKIYFAGPLFSQADLRYNALFSRTNSTIG